MGVKPRTRRTDPKTSHAAAKNIPEFVLTEVKDRIILIHLEARQAGIDGLTDAELYEFYEEAHAEGKVEVLPQFSSVQKRRGDLVEEGYIEATKESRPRLPGPDGKQRKTRLTVWRLSRT